MDTIRFSVLIPVYNVEKYLSACIESVLNQTYQNFESRFTPAEEIFKLVEREKAFKEEDFAFLYNTRFKLFVESIKSVCAFKIKTSEKIALFGRLKQHKHYNRLVMALKTKKSINVRKLQYLNFIKTDFIEGLFI